MDLFLVKKAADMVRDIVADLNNIRKARLQEINELEKEFGLLDILAPYYVTPDAQNLNPADFPDDDTGMVARQSVLDMLDIFLGKAQRSVYAIILSDSGMGKTSLLVMLKLFYIKKLFPPKYNVQLFRIDDDVDAKIGAIPNPGKTILLLDALDEDPHAWDDFRVRLGYLLYTTKSFRKVLITCRTQFFPAQYEEDTRLPGVVLFDGYLCSKIYLSPFSDQQVQDYLKKKFPNSIEREKAHAIIQRIGSLKFRPMLLSYMEFLLDSKVILNDTYSIYDEPIALR